MWTWVAEDPFEMLILVQQVWVVVYYQIQVQFSCSLLISQQLQRQVSAERCFNQKRLQPEEKGGLMSWDQLPSFFQPGQFLKAKMMGVEDGGMARISVSHWGKRLESESFFLSFECRLADSVFKCNLDAWSPVGLLRGPLRERAIIF